MIVNKQPQLTSLDRFLEITGLLFLVATCAIPVVFWDQMPDSIPVHYDWGGTPDRYGSKGTVLRLPFIGVAIYVALFVVKRYTRRMNFPVPVTEANRDQMYTLTFQMMRWIRFSIALLFLLLVSSSVQVAIGKAERAQTHFMIYFLLAIAAIVGIHMYRMINLHQDPED